jgi:hypothetical protein
MFLAIGLMAITNEDKKFSKIVDYTMNRDSVVDIATGYGLDEFESRWRQEFSRLHVVQTGFGAHPASYPMGTGGSFLGGKATGV